MLFSEGNRITLRAMLCVLLFPVDVHYCFLMYDDGLCARLAATVYALCSLMSVIAFVVEVV